MVSKNSHDNSVFHQIVCLQSVEKIEVGVPISIYYTWRNCKNSEGVVAFL